MFMNVISNTTDVCALSLSLSPCLFLFLFLPSLACARPVLGWENEEGAEMLACGDLFYSVSNSKSLTINITAGQIDVWHFRRLNAPQTHLNIPISFIERVAKLQFWQSDKTEIQPKSSTSKRKINK